MYVHLNIYYLMRYILIIEPHQSILLINIIIAIIHIITRVLVLSIIIHTIMYY